MDIHGMMDRALIAAAVFSQLDQEQTDRIVRAVYEAAFNERVRLARLAAEETGLGVWRDKVIKNAVATQYVYEDIRDLKTVGVISEDKERGITEIAQPMGPILAIIPVTNPTSTVFFKILIALKTRNPIIICPSKRAGKCSSEAARVCYEAALAADAPEDCIQWLAQVSKGGLSPRELTRAVMQHPKLALILATGGAGLVREAYSSGTPALGVGAGNVPVFFEASADVPFAVEQLLISKTFDNGTICASEQALVVEAPLAAEVESELRKRGGFFLSPEEVKLLERVAWNGHGKSMSPEVVGQSACRIAELAGIAVPPETRLLLAPLEGVGHEHPLSGEILAPILAYYVAPDFDEAVKLCIDINYHGGIGHTASIFSNDDDRILSFSLRMNAGRILVNTPSSQGGVGGIYNRLSPSLTLGCGTGGKNITTENVTARHLINIQRITRRREDPRKLRFDADEYLDESRTAADIEADFNRNC
jgi:acetaldehyde dehydrogenase/alcohol dehydrogenase